MAAIRTTTPDGWTSSTCSDLSLRDRPVAHGPEDHPPGHDGRQAHESAGHGELPGDAPQELAVADAGGGEEAVVASDQVVEHALRHLAWLAEDDPVVRRELSDEWREALHAYVPEPFRNLG